jgi:type IV pilus assembly protein PilW
MKKVLLTKNTDGFTLIELLVAVAVASIFILAAGQLFITTNEINTVQEQLAGTQQNIRAAMELMARDIRLAGLDPTGAAAGVGFLDNGGDEDDTDNNSIAIGYDLTADGVTAVINRTYFYRRADEKLMITDGGNTQSLTEDGTISSLTFNYTLANGNDDADPTGSGNLGNIRVVTINICGKITGAFEDKYTGTYCFTNTIRPRNM